VLTSGGVHGLALEVAHAALMLTERMQPGPRSAVLEYRCWLVPALCNANFVLTGPEPSESCRSSQAVSGTWGSLSAMMMENARSVGRRKGKHREVELVEEAPAEQRAAERHAVRTTVRLYCVMCGRSEIVERAPVRPGRCSSCDGTLLTEFDAG
jgi:hypothetical protein